MKNFPSYKFLRFFITDREVTLRSVVLLVLIIIIFAQLKTLRTQERQLAALKAGQKTEQTRSHQRSSPMESPKEELVLEGVTLKFGAPYAVISGEIYKADDEIGNYTLSEIGQGFIVLKHKDKDESKKIYFSQRLPGDVLLENE